MFKPASERISKELGKKTDGSGGANGSKTAPTFDQLRRSVSFRAVRSVTNVTACTEVAIVVNETVRAAPKKRLQAQYNWGG